MATIMLTNITAFLINTCYFSVAPFAAKFFDVNETEFDLLILVNLLILPPFMLVAVFVAERCGLKWCVRIAVLSLILGGTTRLLATLPKDAQIGSMEGRTKFFLVLVGGVLIEIGHPFVMIVATKTSQTWFTQSERMLTTGLLGVAPTISQIVVALTAPKVVAGDQANVPYLAIIFVSPVLLCLICTIIFLRTSEPSRPPSKSAEELGKKPPLTIRKYLGNLLAVLSNRNIWIMLVASMSLLGKLHWITSQLAQVMCSTNYSTDQAGTATAVMTVSGLVGGVLYGSVVRRFGRQVEGVKVSYALSSVACIGLLLCLRLPDVFGLILLFAFLFGFFGLSSFPLFLELAVESAFPLDPVISEVTMHFPGQIYSFLIILIGNNLHWQVEEGRVHSCKDKIAPLDYTPFFYLFMAETTIISILLPLTLNPKLKRSQRDEKE